MPDAGGRLRLRCLGSLRLEDPAGVDITPRTRKARAVLAYLALLGRPVSRARLADLLWSDRAGEQARASVRQALFELRHLSDGAALIASPARDEVALNGEMLTTDLSLIRIAAQAGDWDRLQKLLSESDPGLLIDLDGLDPEFDLWLQVERGDEPPRTFAAALAAADRCLAEAGPRHAQEIVAEVQRLDPTCEEAARLALRIDHEMGDNGALHRHFELFRDRLNEDYATEPSDETQELFRRLTSAFATPKRARAVNGNVIDDSIGLSAPAPASIAIMTRRWTFALIAVALLALIGAAWWQFRSPLGGADRPVLIAVLPFEHQQAGDRYLAEGLWDDTRAALARNPGLRVLGRETTRTMADAGETPKAYRRRLGVAFLLDGRVRRDGERVRVMVSLTRTADGISVWESAFNGRLGDPLTLQEAMARGIEGGLRGRLARGGGTRPEHISTSPEVYDLYSEARVLLRDRGLNNVRAAAELLRRAVALDPNFAPAWASLAAATSLGKYGPEGGAEKQREALSYARRALALAPNLAQAHATLALVDGGSSLAAERALERAVALDPGNSEAWNWLGNARQAQYRSRAALAAYERGVEIDPLWWPVVLNMAAILAELGDNPAVERLANRLVAAGADREAILSMRAEAAIVRGDYSAALQPLLAVLPTLPGQSFSTAKSSVGDVLVRVGYQDQAALLWNYPTWFGPVLRSERLPPDSIAGEPVGARDFWLTPFFATFASRAMINHGRGSDLIAKFRQGFRSRDDFVYTLSSNGSLVTVAPNLAIALRAAGEEFEANYLLAAAERRLAPGMKAAFATRDVPWDMARIRGAQGRREEAVKLIARAVDRGWLPEGRLDALDIAQEPALRGLHGDPRFEQLRRRILAHIARERAELGPIKL